MQSGQKIYVFNHETQEPLCEPIYAYMVPSIGEMLTYFDEKTGTYYHCEIIRVIHGASSRTNRMVSSLYVKIISKGNQ